MSKHFYHQFFFILLFILAAVALSAQATPEEISLRSAINRALTHNPGLQAEKHLLKAAEGQIIQAGLRPNPEISLEFEKFGGNSEFAGNGQLEDTLALSQEILTGGKRFFKIKAARIEKQIAIEKQKLARRDLIAGVCRIWLQINRLDKLIEIEREFVRLGTQNLEAIKRKVSAGEAPKIDETKAHVETATVKTELRKMQRERESLKYELSAFWGGTTSDFSLSNEDMNFCRSLNFNDEKLEEMLQQITEVSLARLKKDLAEAQHRLAKADGQADFSIEGGITRERIDNKHHYFVGVSMPLQIFDRNQGNRASTKALVREAEKNLEQTILTIRTRLIELHKKTTSVSEEFKTATENLLPAAEEAFTQMQTSYDEGERELFELIDARRVKLEAEKAVIQLESEELESLIEICLKTGCREFFNFVATEAELNHEN